MRHDKDITVLVADAGGTNVRVALGTVRGKQFSATARKDYRTAEFKSLTPVIEDFLQTSSSGSKIQALAVCGAGPVRSQKIVMSNADFSITLSDLESKFGLPTVIMNDFSAMTWGVLALNMEEEGNHVCIHGTPRNSGSKAPVVALGPGTGLGFGYAVYHGAIPCVFASEGGHTAIPAWDRRSGELAAFVQSKFPEGFDAEKVISGPGLAVLYEFIGTVNGRREEDPIAALPVKERPARITKLALEGNKNAVETIELFVSLLARFCAEAAAVFLPESIFITGGVCQKIKGLMSRELFSAHFSGAWAPALSPVLSDTPVFLAGDEDTGLQGLAYAAATHLFEGAKS